MVPKVTKETLLDLYNEKRFPASKIAEDLGVGTSTIYRWMIAYKIPKRNKSEARKLVWMNPIKKQNYLRGIRRHANSVRKFNLRRESLYNLYWVDGLSQSQIAKKVGFSRKLVSRRFREYNIPIKTREVIMREAMTDERKKELSRIMKQRWMDPEYREKTIKSVRKSLKKYKRIHRSPHTEFKRGHKIDNMIREKIRRTVQRNYQEDPELLKRVLSCQKPNKAENVLINLLRKHSFPFRYVGNGQIIIDGKCPDFIGIEDSRKVIELFGRPWHDPSHSDKFDVTYDRTEEGRKKFFTKHGYDCLIVWDDELGDEGKIVERINTFIGAEQHIELYEALVSK